MFILPFSEQISRQPIESESQHKELTTYKKEKTERASERASTSATSDKSQATEHSFYCSNDAHSYDYLMVTFIFLFLFLSFIFRSSLIHLKVDCCSCCFSCFFWYISFVHHSLVRFRSFVLYVLLSVRLNAIIQLNGRVCQRCQMTGNGHRTI